MRHAVLLLTLLSIVGCGSDSPTGPTAAATPTTVVPQGDVLTFGCVSGSNGLAACATFSGTAQNVGAGCAANVRGVLTTYTNPFGNQTGGTQVGSATWSYAGTVRPSDQIAFSGGAITVALPLFNGWYYVNNISWDNVSC